MGTPENITIVKFAGGDVYYRLQMHSPAPNGPCVVETFVLGLNPGGGGPGDEYDHFHDVPADKKFNTSGEAWAWIGEQLSLAPPVKYLVSDTEFNRANHPLLIGRLYEKEKSPSCACEPVMPCLITTDS
jgi:hypothetical protein